MPAMHEVLPFRTELDDAAEIERLRARVRVLETELATVRQPVQSVVVSCPTYAGVIVDASGPDGTDFLYEDATPATEAFFARPLCGMRASELGLAPEVIAATVAMIRQSAETGRATAREHAFPTPGRQDGWYFGTCVPQPRTPDGRARAAFTVTDITWRRDTERAVMASEARFRTLADASPGIVYEATAAEGNVFVNRTYRDFTGLQGDSLLGSGWAAAIHPEDLPRIVPIAAAGRARRVPFDYETRIRRHDGAWRWFMVSITNQPDADGLDHWYGVGVDIHERKAAEAALRESEQRFRTLADSAPVLIWESDAEGSVTWVNRAWTALTGRTLEQEIGEGWTQAVHPDDLPRCLAIFHDAIARRVSYRMDYRLRRADGAWRTMNEVAAPHLSPDGRFLGIIGSCVDETEARAAQAALILSEETLRLAVEAADLGLWHLDLRTHVLHWSPRCRALFGILDNRPVSLKDFDTCVHPDDLVRVNASFARVCDPEIRAEHDQEYRVIGRDDGVERWIASKGHAFFDADGRPVRALGTTLDITTRKQTEAALRRAAIELGARVDERTAELAESEARFRAYFESVEDCLFTVAVTKDGRFLYEGYNPHGARRTGFAADAVRGRGAGDFMTPGMAADFETLFAAVRDRGTQRFTKHLAFPGGDGVFDTLLVPIRDPSGRLVRILGASREVTEQVRLEDELRQTQKMQAIGQLTGGIAHDFNNLLTGISGNLELLAHERLGERGRLLLVAARRSVERGARLTAQLLAFARRQRLQPLALDLNALVGGMVGLLGSTLGGTVRVHTDLAPDLWPGMGDATQLELAILNVAINARDAMPDGGTIFIATANAETGPPRAAEDPPAGAHVMVAIRDTGSGMPPEVLGQVFEPFFTTKGAGRGSGLGLSQVVGVAKQLGGGVTVRSRTGEGTEVRIYLPRAAAAAAVTVEPAAVTDPGVLRGARILVIDDDADVRDVTAAMLEELGCAVQQSPGGAEALAAVAGGMAVDAALIDYAMPSMNGAETMARLRLLRPDMPMVMATGYAEAKARVGSDVKVLRKPFSADDLAAAFGPLLSGARAGG